jgi:hypothetical protein
MDVLMDGLLMAATLFAGGYCWVLARRVNALKSLDKGLGGAIVTLTRQVELARATLEEARAAAGDTREELGQLITHADTAAGQLRLLLAATRDAEPRRTVAAAVSAATAQPATASRASLALAEPPMPEIEAPAEADVDADAAAIPKPRELPPIENPLRARGKDEAQPRSEDEIIEALRAIAGGGGSR